MKGKFIPKIPGENVSYPGKKYPDTDRPEIKFPDPDRPEIKFPDPTRKYSENCSPTLDRFRSGPVRGNSGFRVAPQVFIWEWTGFNDVQAKRAAQDVTARRKSTKKNADVVFYHQKWWRQQKIMGNNSWNTWCNTLQILDNIWEWTRSNYVQAKHAAQDIIVISPLTRGIFHACHTEIGYKVWHCAIESRGISSYHFSSTHLPPPPPPPPSPPINVRGSGNASVNMTRINLPWEWVTFSLKLDKVY